MKLIQQTTAFVITMLMYSASLIGAASITSINPVSGPTAGGTVVTINGSGFTGTTSVKFGTLNASTFSPPIDGGTPVFYRIFRNNHLIATIPATGLLEFDDHNRRKNTPYTYTVVTVDALGNESVPAVFNFTGQKCHHQKHKKSSSSS